MIQPLTEFVSSSGPVKPNTFYASNTDGSGFAKQQDGKDKVAGPKEVQTLRSDLMSFRGWRDHTEIVQVLALPMHDPICFPLRPPAVLKRTICGVGG